MVVSLTEIVDKSSRTIGFSLAYSIATAIYGGFTPMIATALIHKTGNDAMPGVWLSVAALCSFITVIIVVCNKFLHHKLTPARTRINI